MTLNDARSIAILAGLGAVLAGVIWIATRGAGRAAQDIAQTVTKSAGEAIQGAIEGTVKGAGDSIGLPDPETAEAKLACCAAINAGDKMAASLNCEYSQFMDWIFRNKKPAHCKTGGASGTW